MVIFPSAFSKPDDEIICFAHDDEELTPAPAIRMADIRRISVTSRMGSVNFANHKIKENNCIY